MWAKTNDVWPKPETITVIDSAIECLPALLVKSQITLKKTSRPLYGRTLENYSKIMVSLRRHPMYWKRRSLFWIRKIHSFRKVKAKWLQLRKEALSRKVKVVEDTKKDSPEKPEAEKRGEELEIPNTPELEFEENKNCQI